MKATLAVGRIGKFKLAGLFVLVTMACTVAGGAVHTPKAAAVLTADPFPLFQIPANEFNYLINCDDPAVNPGIQTPAVLNWVSPLGSPGLTSVNVNYGDPSVDLQWNFAGIVCRPQAVRDTRAHALSGTATDAGTPFGTVGPVSPAALDLDFQTAINGKNRNNPGAYRQAGSGFTFFAPPGGFTTSVTVLVKIQTRTINDFGGGIFGCVLPVGAPPAGANDLDDYSLCPDTYPGAFITINVAPAPNADPSGTVSLSCDPGGSGLLTAVVNASDPDGGNVGVQIDVPGANPASRSGTGSGVIDIGGGNQFQGVPGGTYQASGSVWDGVGGSAVIPDSNVVTCALPAPTLTCSILLTGNPFETNQDFTIQVILTRTGSSAEPVIPASTAANPMSIAITPNQPGATLSGVPATVGYPALPSPPSSTTVTWTNTANSATPATFDVVVTVPGYNTCPGNIIVGNKSYPKVYGGQAVVGGMFNYNAGADCAAGPAAGEGGVYAFAKDNGGGQYIGASTQLTLRALLDVKGMFSAGLRDVGAVNTHAPAGLTMATDGTEYGGNFGGKGICIEDYYTETQDPTLHTAAVDGLNLNSSANVGADRGRVQKNIAGSTTISNGGSGIKIPLGTQMAVYVDGDVYIGSDITYTGQAGLGFGEIDRLQMFVLIVRGNIYVDSDVTHLDGIYIAQPTSNSDPNSGRFFSCTKAGGAKFTLNDMYGDGSAPDCRKQLVINGSVIAKQFKFMRMNGTLSSGTYQEQPVDYDTGAVPNVGEVINHMPETWLATSPLKIPNDVPPPYDSIRELAPLD